MVGPEGGGQFVWSSHRVPVRGMVPRLHLGHGGANIWQWLGHLDLLIEAQESPAGLGKQLGNSSAAAIQMLATWRTTAASEPIPPEDLKEIPEGDSLPEVGNADGASQTPPRLHSLPSP